MLRFLIGLLFGYCRVSVQTADPVRLINRLRQADIFIWAPKSKDTEMRFCCMKRAAPKMYDRLCTIGITDIKVKGCGIPFLLSTTVRKICFVTAAASFILLPLVCSNFVCRITVDGNTSVAAEDILETLALDGVKLYAYIPNLQLKDSRQQLLLSQPKLSWATLNLVGNTIEVIVHEKTGKQTVRDNQPCNIVAEYDGMICKAQVLCGKQLVKAGAAVRKGQLLVSGFLETETGHLSYLHAQGSFIAQVELQKSYTVDLDASDYTALEKGISHRSLQIFGCTVPLYHAGHSVTQPYTVFEQTKLLQIGDYTIPIGITLRNYTLYRETPATLTKTDAIEILNRRMEEYERYELEDAVVLGRNDTVTQDGSKLTLTSEFLLQTDIAKQVLIGVVE